MPQRCAQTLAGRFRAVHVLELPDGEAHKDWQTLNLIFDALLEPRLRPQDRAVRARRRRGRRHGRLRRGQLHARRALRAGADHAARPGRLLGRRQDGDQPSARQEHDRRVLPAARWCCATSTRWRRCRARELSAGLAEVIKYGPIADCAFLDWLEANIDALLARDPAALAHAVAAQLRDQGRGRRRRTSAKPACARCSTSATPSATRSKSGLGYGAWLHGEAVGCGMVMAAHLSQRLGVRRRGVRASASRALIERAGLPVVGAGARRRALPRADAHRQESRRPARSASSCSTSPARP